MSVRIGNENAQLQYSDQSGGGDHLYPSIRDFLIKVTYKSNRCHIINAPRQLYSITEMENGAVNGCLRTRINLSSRHSAATTVVNMSEC